MSKNSQVILDQLINDEIEQYGEKIKFSDFFEFYTATQILKPYELSYDEIESGLVGSTLDGGADAIYIFINKEEDNLKDKYKKNVDIEMVFIQSKYENSFGEDTLLKLGRLCSNLFDLDFRRSDHENRYNENVLDAFELFRKTFLSLSTKRPRISVKFYYASKGIDVHPNVTSQGEDLKKDILEKLPNCEVEVIFLGAEKLVKLAQERPNETYRLKISEKPISTSGNVFIALAPLSEYFRFITDDEGNIIRQIFESNVRDYHHKSDVNLDIRRTLESPGNEEFWWLNNGVTILASEASSVGKELIIHNPEIVNGLQTSSEIQRFFSANDERISLDNRDILIRVIVPEDEKTRDHIIRATNSQTPIPKASLRTTDPIHRQIEDYFKPRGLYYDRRKNFYKNEGKKPKDIISVPYLGQCLMSVLMQRPDAARARPSTLLDVDASYNRLFHKNNDLSTYYIVAKIGRKVEQWIKTYPFEVSEINDIKFYVLYSIFSVLVENVHPTNSGVSKVKETDVSEDLISAWTLFVYDLYKDYGGNDKAAKGTAMIEKLRNKLRVEIENYS
jgi:hypothetical protein